jgi:hypothetical protein
MKRNVSKPKARKRGRPSPIVARLMATWRKGKVVASFGPYSTPHSAQSVKTRLKDYLPSRGFKVKVSVEGRRVLVHLSKAPKSAA